jgi:L-threonylcarbamoyladenylate synthase
MTTVVRVGDLQTPAARQAIRQAAKVLREGGLVAFPTETVYGLGANALNAEAVTRIFQAKGRPAYNPLIVHVATVKQARALVTLWPRTATLLAKHFWPGPLTLVLPRQLSVPEVVTAGGPTVAIRIPSHPVALTLLRATGVPVAAPSANPSQYLSPTRPEHVLRGLDGRIDMLLDAGKTRGGIESTVLDLSGSTPRLLRPGLIPVADLETLIGRLEISGPRDEAATDRILHSPGMLARHYAPRATLEVVAGDASPRVRALLDSGKRVGWLALSSQEERLDHPRLHIVEMPHNPVLYGAILYEVLHELDAVGMEYITVTRPPEDDSWLAVQDRLRRASTQSN